MPAPAMSHLICTSAIVTLIFVLPLLYTVVVDNIQKDLIQRELQEIADYTSNTLANLYFIINATDYSPVSLEKEMIHLPATVENYLYTVVIDGSGGNATKITVYLQDASNIAHSWLVPGLKIGPTYSIDGGREAIAGCSRNDTGIFVWLQ